MDFLLASELVEFRDSLRKFFSSIFTEHRLRENLLSEQAALPDRPTAKDQAWAQLAALGALAAPFAEEHGGLGMGLLAAQVVLEESSRVITDLPVLETLLSAELLAGAGTLTVEGTAKLTAITAGELSVSCPLDAAPSAVEAVPQDAGYLLNGSLRLVPAVERTGSIFVAARCAGSNEPALFSLEHRTSPATLTTERIPTLDLLRSFSNIKLDGAPAERLCTGPFTLDRFSERLAVLIVAELSGTAEKVIEMTSEYVKTRTQFGRAIGSFQAVQHKLADMLLKSEQTKSLGRFAGWAADNDPSQREHAAVAAKGFASENVPALIEQALQAHGGIGFTYEYPLHLYLRRAMMLARASMAQDDCYERLAELTLEA